MGKGKDPLEQWQEEREDKTIEDHDEARDSWNTAVEDDRKEKP